MPNIYGLEKCVSSVYITTTGGDLILSNNDGTSSIVIEDAGDIKVDNDIIVDGWVDTNISQPDSSLVGYAADELSNYINTIANGNQNSSCSLNPYRNGYTVRTQAYKGAIYSPNQNRVYFIPSQIIQDTKWHCVELGDGSIIEYSHGLTPLLNAGGMEGAVYCPLKDRIYLCPMSTYYTTYYYYLDCKTNTWVETAHGLTSMNVGTSIYVGGCYSPTEQRIYFAPAYSFSTASKWHYIDCTTGVLTEYTHGATGVVFDAYAGVCYDPNNDRIYFTPYFQSIETTWHYINCATSTVVDWVHGQSYPVYGWVGGGVYAPTQQRIYFTPDQAGNDTKYYYLDVRAGIADNAILKTYTHGQSIDQYGYACGVFVPNQNRIYFIPKNMTYTAEWHYVDCSVEEKDGEATIQTYEHGLGVNYFLSGQEFWGGCYDPFNRKIWLSPFIHTGKNEWYVLEPLSDGPGAKNLMSGPLYNTY